MTLKRIAIVLLMLMVVLLAGTGATIVWLMNTDLKPLAEKYASESIGRPVTLEPPTRQGHILRSMRLANTVISFSACRSPRCLATTMPRR